MSKLIITVGAPASGKSTWVQKYKHLNPDVVVLSSDELRGKFGRDESDQSVSGKVFAHMEAETDRLLGLRQDVIIDATNMHLKARKPWIGIAKKHDATLIAYVFKVYRDELIKRNESRSINGGRNVPVDVIDRMLNNFVPPTEIEGFNSIIYAI